MHQDYEDDLLPKSCWELLKTNNTHLVDCRTNPEWQFVGVPDLSSLNKKVILIEWQIFPHMSLNERFHEDIQNQDVNVESNIILICRSGGRSKSAAEYLSSKGYKHCFNCLYGFEGVHDKNDHRGNVNGWKFDNLPWKQI